MSYLIGENDALTKVQRPSPPRPSRLASAREAAREIAADLAKVRATLERLVHHAKKA